MLIANGRLPVLQDVFHLYAFALCLQIFIHIPYFIKAATFKQTPLDVVHKLLDICCYAAPIGVPTVMLMTGRIGYHRLAKHKISLMFPESLKFGALADVVCFDKTGTLTHSAVRLSTQSSPAAKVICMSVN
jgi:P-type E1-E2 ATPase